MFPQDEAKEKVDQLDVSSPSHPRQAQQPPAHIGEATTQPSPQATPALSVTHLSVRALSPQKSPSSSANIKSSTDLTSSFSSLTQLTEGQLDQLPREDQKFQQNHQHEDTQKEDTQHERTHFSDSDSSSGSGKLDRNRRFREFVPDVEKDDVYWEKRRKNNEAARRSREKRRMNDIVLAGKISTLEQDNTILRRELTAFKKTFILPNGHVYNNKETISKKSAIQKVPDKSCRTGMNRSQSSHPSRLMGTVNKLSSHMPYSAPPPLLAMTDAVPMGLTISNPGWPYFIPDARNLNQDCCLKMSPSSFATGFHQYHDHHMSNQYLYHAGYIEDIAKQERTRKEEAQVRERSNSSLEATANVHPEPSQTSILRRSNVGNYLQYRHHLSSINAEAGHHRHYGNCHVNQANPIYPLQHVYDNQTLLQCSPVSSHSSDDNYEEPLQLTVPRGSAVSKTKSVPVDDNNRDSASNAAFGVKTTVSASSPVSPIPLTFRHKLPSHDVGYPAALFPTTMPPTPVALSQTYPNSSFIGGTITLSDSGLPQTNPLSLVKADVPTPYTLRKNAFLGSRKQSPEKKYIDIKYLERRRRNNEAARKCRENRKCLLKIREAKSSYLETENVQLKTEVTSLQEEMKQLRELIEKKKLEVGVNENHSAVES